MTDPELTAAQEQAVRALLAAARHDEPLPADVAARLDATLADLQAEREAGREAAAPAPVVPLSRAARRRRITGAALVAAAAVVVAGVGIGQLTGGVGSDSGESSMAGDAGAEREYAGGAVESPLKSRPNQSSAPEQQQAPADSASERATELDAQSFREDVRRLAPADELPARVRDRLRCEVPGTGRGTRVAVTYETRDGVLVFRDPAADRQRVDLYLCGSDAIVRTVVLRSR